jgi:hypothetical protein
MTNPQTFYTVTVGQDLSGIFQPYTSGSKASNTDYKIPNGTDLKDIFAPYIFGYAKANTTNYIVNNINYSNLDLKDIFAKKQNVFPTNNQLYTSSQTFSDFIMPTGKTNFEFSFCGSGGQGYTTLDDSTRGELSYGGGGSGGWIQAKNIPYLLGSSSITSINITIGGTSASTVVTVNYSNNTMIKLTAGGGVSATYNSGSSGKAGGTCAITTNTAGWNTSNYTAVTGAKGGDKDRSGVSSGKTSSGS